MNPLLRQSRRLRPGAFCSKQPIDFELLDFAPVMDMENHMQPIYVTLLEQKQALLSR